MAILNNPQNTFWKVWASIGILVLFGWLLGFLQVIFKKDKK